MTLIELILSLVIISGTIIALLVRGLGKKSHAKIANPKPDDANPTILQNKNNEFSPLGNGLQQEIEKQFVKLADPAEKSPSVGKNKKDGNKKSTPKTTQEKKSKAKKNASDNLILS